MTHGTLKPLQFDPATETYRGRYEVASATEAEQLLVEVVSAVTDLTDRPVTDVAPLGEVIDVDRVAHLIADRRRRVEAADVTLTIEDSRVTITDREVVVRLCACQ